MTIIESGPCKDMVISVTFTCYTAFPKQGQCEEASFYVFCKYSGKGSIGILCKSNNGCRSPLSKIKSINHSIKVTL